MRADMVEALAVRIEAEFVRADLAACGSDEGLALTFLARVAAVVAQGEWLPGG